ncbi:MAG: saccharopine dehydrogenase NADP-binding domain-containing protein [Caldilineaceae bacterium]|nr:saccharopine dehydrogenase NADP-binding domain-containing protein [Caldilineaceae bacterium]
MKILVLGSGLMGPAAAYNALQDSKVMQVTLADMHYGQLELAESKLREMPGFARLALQTVDLQQWTLTTRLMAEHDVIIAALPTHIIAPALRAAMAMRRPWIDLTWPAQNQLDALAQQATDAGVLVIPGCGVEPGLTEIMARHLAEQLERVDELHIKCGGIPTAPAPPLGYKIVFGGRRLPLRPYDAYAVQEGELVAVPRYSGVERLTFEGVGEVEAWHEGFVPWLLELDSLRGLKTGSQKTIRWPGFAAKVAVLKELGLLSDDPVDVDGVQVSPKRLLDALLYPKVQMQPEDRDITLMRVDVIGEQQGRRRHLRVEMVDHYDETLGFTSMARVTAFTASIVARMVARGELQGAGLVTPEKLLSGPRLAQLVDELALMGIHFTETGLDVE